jgi:methanogenic corrinoid protein MtbC1
MQIFEEHLFTRTLTRFLDSVTSRLQGSAGGPVVLLATLPGEPHGLGLMMVETLLRDGGTATVNLGAEVPLEQLVQAVLTVEADVLALSFSSSYPYGRLRKNLVELRSRIPDETAVWIGGGGAQRLKRLPVGVYRKTLEDL